MQGYSYPNKWQQARGKRRAHWGILTLDDLDKTNWKHSLLITQLKTRYQVAKELGDNKPKQKSEDYSS